MFESIELNIIGATLLSFVLSILIIPSLINIAEIRHLYDATNERKSHTGSIPNLAGIAIFGSFVISFCLFGFFNESEIKYLIGALCFVFMIGAKDDIVELTPYKKFLGQFIAASVVVYLGDVRLTSLYGIMGISDIPYYFSLAFSIVTSVFIINAFNLIDGVNWLAGGVSLVVSLSFGTWFYTHGFYDYAIMSACIFGAILAFLKYNYSPAKIFLGDSGSLSLGLLTATMAIEFIELSAQQVYASANMPFHVTSGPAMAIAILIIPIFDTLRVFTLRLLNKRSPFSPDRSHHHHRLLDLGFTHEQTSGILVATNIVFIFLTYQLQFLRTAYLIPIIFSVALVFSYLLFNLKFSKKKLNTHPTI
ncbi:MAG TPA: MraY family glycosyltransferase [Chitinophagales bacterium]|nr:MraY family glycosyltransferase [Chitinophagales bacterium]